MRSPVATIKLTLAVTVVLAGVGLRTASSLSRGADGAGPASDFRPPIPAGLPEAAWRRVVPADNPLTAEKVALGRSLFFDKRLSADGTVSCATCHDPSAAFTDHHPLAVGVAGRAGARNAPTVLNAAFSRHLFWDGHAGSLEEQAKHPLINPSEMGMASHDAVVARVSAAPEYRERFRRAFGAEGVTIETVVKAIASFERTQLSGNSPFDRFAAGDAGAISESQKRGLGLFRGKARCAECHTSDAAAPFFTDFGFHNTGVALDVPARAGGSAELGRYLVTGRAADVGAFKTPTLRDVELTAPYMHDGSKKTLLDVVRFYNEGGRANPHLDGRLRPLGLTEAEMSDLVEFLRSLTSDDVLRLAQSAKPQTRTPAPLPGR